MTVSSGFAMEVHYCMGKRAGVDFYNTENDKCSRCGMKEKKGGCCNDEHRFYKLADAHKNVSNNYNASISKIEVVHDVLSFPVNIILLTGKPALFKKLPPIDSGPPIFIKNCVFRV